MPMNGEFSINPFIAANADADAVTVADLLS